MGVLVRIPGPLRSITAGESEVNVEGGSVADALGELESRFPEIRARLRDDQGEVRQFVNLFVNGEDIRFLDGLQTSLKTGDEMSILPAVAGGSQPQHAPMSCSRLSHHRQLERIPRDLLVAVFGDDEGPTEEDAEIAFRRDRRGLQHRHHSRLEGHLL